MGGQVCFDSGECLLLDYDVICRCIVDDEKLVISHCFSRGNAENDGPTYTVDYWTRFSEKLSKGAICRLTSLSAIPMPLKALAKITFIELPVSISTRLTS
ncbi:hypothetical protein L3X38_000369 [Prunus dulcis]|uniref:Uncharacterized protein n=1 Tax=Prunus dulcis TaxID=3755 RepID=A0AAD4USE1_PRUDU|nr:hypothetical protein L3X38_000369 [Prunus dulcis]